MAVPSFWYLCIRCCAYIQSKYILTTLFGTSFPLLHRGHSMFSVFQQPPTLEEERKAERRPLRP